MKLIEHTPGAIRAAHRIHAILKRHLPLLSDSTVTTLVAIIDEETAAPELLQALKACDAVFRLRVRQGDQPIGLGASAWRAVEAAIAKAEAPQ